MIKIRLFTEEEELATQTYYENKRVFAILHELYFEDNWCVTQLKEGEMPFRDAESIKLLKESYGITFADDNDWFSVICDGERMPIMLLNESIKFALTAIHYSRTGVYTWYTSCNKEMWKILSDMSMDILVAVRMKDIYWESSLSLGVDYIIQEYPAFGKRIEVNVVQKMNKGEGFYTKVAEDRDNTEDDLYLGQDGKYYLNDTIADFALRYQWFWDIKGVSEVLSGEGYLWRKYRPYAVDVTQEYSYVDFWNKFCTKEWRECDEYLDSLEHLKVMHKTGFLTERDYTEKLEELNNSEAYKEHLHLVNDVKVISHMVREPKDIIARRAIRMCVDKNKDGTYSAYNEWTYKYPELNDILDELDYKKDIEQFRLIIDMNEVLSERHDMQYAVYGFKVSLNTIEVFDKYEAMLMFGEILKEAYDSGKCKGRYHLFNDEYRTYDIPTV